VPERVVDTLELIQIEIQQRHVLFSSADMLQRLIKSVLEQAAILHPGERIVKSQFLHLSLSFCALTDVVDV